jgi:prepilin-type N-terminal cleavage/methylation domain-containing protein
MKKFKFKRNETGLTLPEVLVAVSIFAIVGVTFVSALGTNVKLLLMADQRTTAESLAKAQLEAINNAPYNATSPLPANPYSTITGIPNGYEIKIVVKLINPETGADSITDLGVQKIACNVTCQWHTPPEVIVVEAYKR